MKKLLVAVLAFSTLLLAGCTEATDYESDLKELTDRIQTLEETKTTLESQVGDLETDIQDLLNDLSDLNDDKADMSGDIVVLEVEQNNLESKIDLLEEALETATTEIETLEAAKAALEAEVAVVNNKIKNALDRENWTQRKVKYNPDFTSYEAEYCLGIFDEDWSTIEANDYTHNGGLKFVITIEEIVWGTEIFVKDSCGNYSVFVYQSSPYALYSIPAGFFEEGKTYEVVLYKEMYFTTYQLGLLPLADMGDFGAYPEDLSGIVSTEVQ